MEQSNLEKQNKFLLLKRILEIEKSIILDGSKGKALGLTINYSIGGRHITEVELALRAQIGPGSIHGSNF